MAQDYENGFGNEDEFENHYVEVSLILPPPHLAAIKRLMMRVEPEDEFEDEVRSGILQYSTHNEMVEIKELAEFQQILEQYADVEVEVEAEAGADTGA